MLVLGLHRSILLAQGVLEQMQSDKQHLCAWIYCHSNMCLTGKFCGFVQGLQSDVEFVTIFARSKWRQSRWAPSRIRIVGLLLCTLYPQCIWLTFPCIHLRIRSVATWSEGVVVWDRNW